MLAGVARGEKGRGLGEAEWSYQMFIPGDCRGLKNEFVCTFELAADMVRVASGSLRMMWTDQPSWKESWEDFVLIGTSRSEFTIVQMNWCLFKHTCFSNVKHITFCTLEFVHYIGGFTVSKGSDGIGQVNVRASKWFCRTSFAVDMVAREGSFQGDGTKTRWGFGGSWVVCRS